MYVGTKIDSTKNGKTLAEARTNLEEEGTNLAQGAKNPAE